MRRSEHKTQWLAEGAPMSGDKPRRKRLSPSEREQMILDAAIDYFAENGFSARVRELASNIGVSQSLIFRYFGSKERLIERVYEKTFLSRWNPEWETILHDRSRTIRDRLSAFYRSYLAAVDERRWIRIAMLSSLAGRNLTRRYIQGPITRLISVIGKELQSGENFRNLDEDLTSELVWHLHSTIIYYLIRKHIHGSAVSRERDKIVDLVIDNFLWLNCSDERSGTPKTLFKSNTSTSLRSKVS
jgi:AcrR family transcriptional regulator